MTPAGPSTKDRLLEAAYACVGRVGLARTTMEDVALEAGLSRATVYRYFPRGKEQLFGEVVIWETGRFFEQLTRAVASRVDLAELLEETLVFAHRAVEEHTVLQTILQTEPERLLPLLTTEANRVLILIKQFVVLAMTRTPLRADLDADLAADHLARMVLSLIGSQGRWDLTDREEVRRLVRTKLLAGVIEGPG